jgi:hypothetical protein
MSQADLQESIIDLCHALKLLSVVAKSVGYPVLSGDQDAVEKMSRDIEQVSLYADKALQRLLRDTGTLRGYPESRTGDLSGDSAAQDQSTVRTEVSDKEERWSRRVLDRTAGR